MEVSVDDIFNGSTHGLSSCTTHIGTIMAPLHGNGLNLSTNHGLDLTCPSYEGLNLSLTQGNQVYANPQPTQIVRPRPPNQPSQGLNLSNSNAPASNNVSHVRPAGLAGHSEVGLNLSIQSSGINLTKGGNGSSSHTDGTFQQQQQYYYTTHTSGGYINLSTQKVSYDESAGSRSQQSQSQTTLFENQRHSPLNLERNRSSPLNLTSGMPHSHVNNCSQNNRTYFPEMPNGNFHHPDHQSNNCNFNPNDASFDMFQTDNSQQQQQQQPGQVETFFQQSTHHPIMTNDQQQTLIGSQPPSQYPYQPCSQHPVPLANTDRTRIFCSHCCLEVSSPLELSKHNMERHGVQEPQAFHKTPSNPAWNAIPTNYQTESSIQQDPSNVQIMSNNPTNYNEQQASSDNTAVVSKSQSVEQTSLPASSLPDNLNSQCSKKEDPPIHNCQSCAMSFKSGPDLKKHLDLVHSGRQSGAALLCRICDKPFEQKSELKSHMEWHAKERPFRCDICDARLANQAGLNRHIKRMHDKVQPYSCKECGKGYYEKHDLVRHMKAHERASQVPNCDICGKVFSTFYQREKHKCKGPEGKFPCEICDSKMDSKESWGFHMWRHTKDPKYIEIGPINKSSSSSSEETKEKS